MSDTNDVTTTDDQANQTQNAGAPPMLPEMRFGAYRVTSGDTGCTLVYGFGPAAFDMTPALKEAGANTDHDHLVDLADKLGKLNSLAIARQKLTPRSMTALRIAVGEVNAAHLQPS